MLVLVLHLPRSPIYYTRVVNPTNTPLKGLFGIIYYTRVVNVAKLAMYYTRVVNSYIHAFRRCVGEIYYTRVVNFGTCVEGGAWKCVCVVHCRRVREWYSALGWWRGWGEPRCLCVGASSEKMFVSHGGVNIGRIGLCGGSYARKRSSFLRRFLEFRGERETIRGCENL